MKMGKEDNNVAPVDEKVSKSESLLVPTQKLKAEALEKIVSGDLFEGISFSEWYRCGSNSIQKYALAYWLISDGRYMDMVGLAKDFFFQERTSREMTPEERTMQENLWYLLVEKGLVKPGVRESQVADKVLDRIMDQDVELEQLAGDIPPSVYASLVQIKHFSNLSQDEMRLRVVNWVLKRYVRNHLGTLSVVKPNGGLNFHRIAELIPENIFRDPNNASVNIIKDYFFKSIMRRFASPEEGLKTLEEELMSEPSEVKRLFLEEIYRECLEINNLVIPPIFKRQIVNGAGETASFPIFFQKYVVWEFLKTKRRLFNADTGSTKTATSYLAMELAGARKVTIFGPAKARETWPKQAHKHLSDDPEVFAVRSIQDLSSEKIRSAKYVFVGTELLVQCQGNMDLWNRIRILLTEERQTDGVIIDESHIIKNPQIQTSRVISDLIGNIEKSYRESYGEKEIIPMIALTATPVVSNIKDLDLSMALLYPDRFAMPGKEDRGLQTFSKTCLSDPKIAYMLLKGEKLILQWGLEDLFGDRLPNPEIERTILHPSSYQMVIYEWVESLSIDAFSKIRLLTYVSYDPDLVKKICRNKGYLPVSVLSEEKRIVKVRELYESWIDWTLNKDPQIPHQQFGAEWIASFGDKETILDIFFDNTEANGVNGFIRRVAKQLGINSSDLEQTEYPSQKYKWLVEFLRSSLSKNEKTIIVSPFHKAGITGYDEDVFSLFMTLKEYFSDLSQEAIIDLDGSKSFRERERQGNIFSNDQDRNLIMVTSMEAVNESIDFSVNSEARKQAVNMVFLAPPWSDADFTQMIGRVNRPGLNIPFKVFLLEDEGTVDIGLYKQIVAKKLLTEIILSGLIPSEEEEKFIGIERFLQFYPDEGQTFIHNTIAKLRGRSEDDIEIELSRKQDGRSYDDYWTEYYYDGGNDEFRLVGDNARLVASIIKTFTSPETRPRGISVGAGSCLLARIAAKNGINTTIDSTDINAHLLNFIKTKYPEIGQVRKERASSIKANNEEYDFADCSFMLSWTKLSDKDISPSDPEEKGRVKVLSEINRVLKISGRAIFTFPESSYDDESFGIFISALEKHFGFKALSQTGKSYSLDIKPKKRIGWIITLQKTGNCNLNGLDIDNLRLLTDGTRYSSEPEKKKDEKKEITGVPDNPLLSSTHFEVVNFNTGQTIFASSLHPMKLSEIVVYDNLPPSINNAESELPDPVDVILKEEAGFKYSLTPENRKIWKKARRMVEEIINGENITFQDTEQILEEILKRWGFKPEQTWDESGTLSRIAKELHRINLKQDEA